MKYKILAVSDNEILKKFSVNQLKDNFSDVDMILSCGDVGNRYLDYLVSALNKRLIYVNGNHIYEYDHDVSFLDCIDGKTFKWKGLKFIGFDGCRVYSFKEHQYSEKQMTVMVLKNLFSLLVRRPDIVISHAPPRYIHDKEDYVHKGFKIFRLVIKYFKPKLWVHGHIHLSSHMEIQETVVEETRVVNAFGYKVIEVEI